MRSRCTGGHYLLSRLHPSRRIMCRGGHDGFFFCAKCAAWTGTVRVDRLAKECPGAPRKPYDLRRLMEGFRVLRDGSCSWRGLPAPLRPWQGGQLGGLEEGSPWAAAA